MKERDDRIDEPGGDIIHRGDAKSDERGRRCDRFRGNARPQAADNLRPERGPAPMPSTPHFVEPPTGRVRFAGLRAPTGTEISRFEDAGRPVRDFRFRPAILDADEAPTRRLRDRAAAASTGLMDRWAPDAWSLAKKGRIVERRARAEGMRKNARQDPD